MAMGLWQSGLFSALPWCAHGITERHDDGVSNGVRRAGVSAGDFSSLNLGLHVGDDAKAVVFNREIAAQRLGASAEDMVCAEQVHGRNVAVVDRSHRGRGVFRVADALPGVDALVTCSPNVLLTLFFADCIPVFLADSRRQVVAVVHAGWRGIVSGVVEATIATMAREFGSQPEDFVAAVGPGIGGCCFEVGDEVAREFPRDLTRRRNGERGGTAHIDLKAAVTRRLNSAGLRDEKIEVSADCTKCDPEQYFSYRRDSQRTGRMGAMIRVKRINT